MSTFNDIVRRILDDGMTTRQLGALSRIDQSTISRWAGIGGKETNPSLYHAIGFAEALPTKWQKEILVWIIGEMPFGLVYNPSDLDTDANGDGKTCPKDVLILMIRAVANASMGLVAIEEAVRDGKITKREFDNCLNQLSEFEDEAPKIRKALEKVMKTHGRKQARN